VGRGLVSVRCSVPSALGSVSLCLGRISRNESDPGEMQTQDEGNRTGEILVVGVARGSKAAQPRMLPSAGVAPLPQQPADCRGLGFPLC